MIYIKPSFYDDFKCTASKCSDNCCIGWEIDVDEETLKKYNNIQGSFGDEIREKIEKSPDGSKCFKLSENDRCPFLNNENLCRIYINRGEDALCDICKNHPRFFEWFPGVTECGLGLSCEEVCRILLSDDKPFELLETNDFKPINLESKEDTVVSDAYIFISGLRQNILNVLFSDKGSFYEKLERVIDDAERFCGEELPLRKNKEIIEAYKNTEPIDEKWTQYIEELWKNSDKYLEKRKVFKEEFKNDKLYPKILAYIFYRHLTKAAFDMDIVSRVCFCLESIRFIEISDVKTYYEKGELTLKDRIENLKNWSKQVEYSAENTDYLIYGD